MNHAHQATRILVVALIAPLVLTAVAIAIDFALGAQLPRSIPVHWDISGHANGYQSPVGLTVTLVAVCVPIVAVFGGITVLWSHRSPVTPLLKILGVTGTFVALVIGTAFTVILVDPAAGDHAWTTIGLPFGIGIIGAAVSWFALPRAVRGVAGSHHAPVAPVALERGERASWIRSSTASPAIIWSLLGLGVLLSVVTIAATLSSGAAFWAVSFVPLLLVVLSLTMFAWTVRVDARGVRVRAALGLPRFQIPLDEITSANVITVQALSQYGGFGIRVAFNSRLGIILRSGPALEVHRRSGLDLVVTIDDAETAAALINGLVQREAQVLP